RRAVRHGRYRERVQRAEDGRADVSGPSIVRKVPVLPGTHSPKHRYSRSARPCAKLLYRLRERPMPHTTFRAGALPLALVLPFAVSAQHDARGTLLISPAALAERLKDPNTVLLHVGEKAQYDSAHIAGARLVTLQDISVSGTASPDGLTLQLPAPD